MFKSFQFEYFYLIINNPQNGALVKSSLATTGASEII